jgi:glycosyltransferase involved in cell wall biosynthesis
VPSPYSPEASSHLRIVHVVTSLDPGGLENGVVNLANHLDPERFQTAIICLERVGAFRARLKANTSVECLEKEPGFRVGAVHRLRRLFWQFAPDVVHSHNIGPLIYSALALWSGPRKWSLLQGEHAELRPDEKTFRRLWMRRICYQACRRVHVVSAGLGEELASIGLSRKKISVTLNGVDLGRFCPVSPERRHDLRARHGIPENAFVLGVVGRFGELKRHVRLLESFDALAGAVPRLHLLIVGDGGPERARVLARMEASPFRGRITWAGFQLEPSLFNQMMDLLVIPSENEGLSNAMLEAMASGVPCLANTACGASEVIQDGVNGLLRTLQSPDALAAAIQEALLAPGLLASLGQSARETARLRFSLATMMETYSKLYREVAR